MIEIKFTCDVCKTETRFEGWVGLEPLKPLKRIALWDMCEKCEGSIQLVTAASPYVVLAAQSAT